MEKSTRKQLSLVSLLVFIAYICILIYFVFFSDHYGRVDGFSTYRYNLTPFAEIRRYLNYAEHFTLENLITNLAGNVLVFTPVGFLLPIFRKKKANLFYVTVAAFFLSLFIETVQLHFRIGVFDVDDLIMNTVGGILGYIGFKIIQKIYRIQFRRKMQRKRQRKKR